MSIRRELMASSGKGRFYWPDSTRALIHVGKLVATDTQFPFGDGEAVKISIDVKNKRLIVEKLNT